MESCYIPNNPQYGLSLEYTAYNNGASFNGTITGFPSSDPVNDNVLCCSGLLQNCGSCDGELGPLRDCGAHCHLQCDDGLNGDLDDFSNKLDNYDTRLAECGGRLTNCDNLSADELGNCDDHLRACEGRLIDCGDQLGECDDRLVDCDDRLRQCDGQLEECNNSFRDCDNGLRECDGGLECQDALGGCEVDQEGTTAEQVGAAGCWTSDDMGSFSLPSLDLDPLPSLFPFSPCSAGYKGELKEKQPHEVADVLLSLKHAVVHPGAELAPPYSQQDAIHPQMVMGGPGCYDSCGPSVFPTMSVNVSMNMTMHGYPPDQMCPQMQWGQNPSTSPMNVMYSQNQGMLSPAPYPGSATYSFTADFRTPNQSDPLITATSSFKPIQISAQKSAQNIQNYNIFGQKPAQSNFTNLGQKQLNFANNNTSQMKTRSSSKLQLNPEHLGPSSGPTYQILGGQNQGHINSHGLGFQHLNNGISLQNGMSPGGGKVQIGALSGCSESEDEQKPNLCRICGKTYARPSTLKTHLRTHSGERPYRCSDCNKSFSQAANLTAHVRTHTGQKPFRCPICDRRFSQSSSVTTHMRTHSGERPYRCRACKKAFSDSSTLTKHLRIHSGEKPYQCKLCLLRFSQSGNLNRHMRVHGNNGSILG